MKPQGKDIAFLQLNLLVSEWDHPRVDGYLNYGQEKIFWLINVWIIDESKGHKQV